MSGSEGELTVRVAARTKVGLFVHALLGVSDAASPVFKDAAEVRREISVEGEGLGALMEAAIRAVHALVLEKHEAYEKAEVLELTPGRFRASLVGKPTTSSGKRLGDLIRVAEPQETDGEWRTEIVFKV